MNEMTSETKTYIEFGDIVGLELTCPACATTVTHTLAKFTSAAYQCPNCNNQMISRNQTDDQMLGQFVVMLTGIQKNLKAPVTVRLQIKSPSASRASSDKD